MTIALTAASAARTGPTTTTKTQTPAVTDERQPHTAGAQV